MVCTGESTRKVTGGEFSCCEDLTPPGLPQTQDSYLDYRPDTHPMLLCSAVSQSTT